MPTDMVFSKSSKLSAPHALPANTLTPFAMPSKKKEIINTSSKSTALAANTSVPSEVPASVGDTSNLTKEEITKILQEAVKKGCEKDVYINDYTDIIFLENNK